MQEFEEMPMNSLLLGLGLAHLRKSDSVSGHVLVLFICCQYHVLDTVNIGNNHNEFLILDKFKFQPTSSCLVTGE